MRFVLNYPAIAAKRQEMAAGLLAWAFETQRVAQEEAPVRGGHRSFDPGGPVGGTLRRSAYSAVFVNGIRVGGSGEMGPSAEPPGRGIVAIVGFSAFYAGFVELGTRFMAARPFLLAAYQRTRGSIVSFVASRLARAA